MTPTVLIVDDSLTVRMDLAHAFEAAGFRALLAPSARETREQLSRELPDLVILDIVLPDADGLELLKEIREDPASRAIPVLLLSSEAEVRDRVRGIAVGADDFVGKPYDLGYVVARAKELLRARPGQPSEASGKILLIDDSLTFRSELERALTAASYTVITAENGEEGLRAAALHRPAAIVVDSVMPGIDGATVIRRIRLDAALRATPCVLLTASEGPGAELRALDAGADAFVRKEDLEVVMARLAAVLRSAGTKQEDAASLLGPKRILAVDDSATYLRELAGVLLGEGYDVVLARSGEEAIEMLAAQPVDCILLDLMMPGLDGKETCRQIKQSPIVRDIPLIMLTALEDRGAMIDGLSTGADDFISKSSDFEVLKARVRAQLRRKQMEDEHRRIREQLLRRELEATEARAARELAETRAVLVEELERKNQELEAFSYTVSHDLRAPLRSIDGFCHALTEECEPQLDETGKNYLKRVRAAARRMSELIDDLLGLSRIGRVELRRERIDIALVAAAVAEELARREPARSVSFVTQPALFADADARLIKVLFENLLGNAWKFTASRSDARVELAAEQHAGAAVYFVRDNGAGFNMDYANKLFRPFQRLHSEQQFPGTGIGLATVRRIVERHGGRVWAEGKVGEGAKISFSLSRA